MCRNRLQPSCNLEQEEADLEYVCFFFLALKKKRWPNILQYFQMNWSHLFFKSSWTSKTGLLGSAVFWLGCRNLNAIVCVITYGSSINIFFPSNWNLLLVSWLKGGKYRIRISRYNGTGFISEKENELHHGFFYPINDYYLWEKKNRCGMHIRRSEVRYHILL